MPVTLHETRSILDRRAGERMQRLARQSRELRALVPQAADLARQHGAVEVWLFGSLAHGELTERSDVDLAVRGVPPERQTDLHVALTRLFPVPVDLVDLDRASGSLQEQVRQYGVAL